MDKIKEILRYNEIVPNPLHRNILSLNPCHIITTNYDDLIEQELLNEFMQFDVVREDKEIPQMVNPSTLVKMHGDFSKDNIVLTEKDYYDYSMNFPLMRAFVQSLFASKLVLFVGFSFTDMNLKMILNELQNILSESMQRAYLLSCEEPDYITKHYYEKKGINILYLSEKDADDINGYDYTDEYLTGIGQHTSKVLCAIKNYSATSKEDLAQYLYMRIQPYLSELRSFGDGLRYFFPEIKEMFWNAHSEGLQTGIVYFKNLGKELKTNQAKRQFLLKHPAIKLRTLLEIAYYNYLFEIDGLKIIDDRFLQNKEKYLGRRALSYIHRFDSEKVSQMLKNLRGKPISYTIDDLELPYALYVLGDYREAFQRYVKLLPLYWNRKRYILYFICRYNLWSIRYAVQMQLIRKDDIDINKETEIATEKSLDDILHRLPLDYEIKKIFQDLISFRFIGEHAVSIQKLKEDIYQQRKSAEKGGCSFNSNAAKLMSIYGRESLFLRANYIICDNNKYYESISDNYALGIINSFATLPTTMFGGQLAGSRITALNAFMLEALIFDVRNERIKKIIKGYEINELKYDDNGIDYINACLDGLAQKQQTAFRNDFRFYDYLNNLLLLLGKSKEQGINTTTLYKVLIKYESTNYRIQRDKTLYISIIRNYEPPIELAKNFIWKLLIYTTEHHQNALCIYELVKKLRNKNANYDGFEFDKLPNKKGIATEIGFLYPILLGETKKQVLEFSLDNIDCLYDYSYFILHNEVYDFSVERFKELLSKEDGKNIDENTCFVLAEIKRCEGFNKIHTYIYELAQTSDCLRFFLSPFDFQNPENVKIEWIFKYDDEKKKELFKVDAYKELLKQYIASKKLCDSDKEYLINFL